MTINISRRLSRLALVAGLLSLSWSRAAAGDYTSRYGIVYDIISDTEAEASGTTEDRETFDLSWLADDFNLNGKTYHVVGIKAGTFRGKTISGWISGSLTYIGADAFRDCKYSSSTYGFPSITVRAKDIGAGAFAGLSMADGGWLDIRLSPIVEHIGTMAFASDAIDHLRCRDLQGTIPQTDGDLCEARHYSQIELVCEPTELWEQANPWKKFQTIYTNGPSQQFDTSTGVYYDYDSDALTTSLRSGFSYHARSVVGDEVVSIGQTRTYSVYTSNGWQELEYAVTAVGSYALGGSAMTSLQLPATLRQVGEGAFAFCDRLTEVVVLASEPPAMPKQAFANNVLSTATLYVPASAEQSYREAGGWKWFSNIVAIDNSIAANAVFRAQSSSTRLVYIEKLKDDYKLPTESEFPIRVEVNGKEKMVLGLDDGTCDNQTSLEHARLPFGYLQIGTFKKCTALQSVVVPATVQELGWHAFEGCTALTDVTLERGVMRLQNRAFYGCSALEHIVLPSTIERICDRAFWGTALTDLTIHATTPPMIFQKSFEGRWDEVTLHVPHGTKEVYDTTAYYNQFKQIVEMAPGTTEPEPDYSDMPDVPVTRGSLMLDFSKMALEAGFADKMVQGVYLNQMSSMGDRYDAEEGCLELHSLFDPMDDGNTEVRLHSMYYGPFFFKHLIGGILFRLPQGKGTLRYDVHGGREVLLTGQLVNLGGYIGASRVRYTATDQLNIQFEKGALVYIFANKWVGDGTRIYNLCWTPDDVEPGIDAMSADSYTYYDSPFMYYQDLSGCVINNVYYCLDPTVAAEVPGSIIVSRRQDEAQMDAIVSAQRDPTQLKSSEYVGLVMKVPAGKSYIDLDAECLGSGALHVRVGTQPVKIIDREGANRKVLVECNVAEPSLVYIYCGDKTYAARASQQQEAPAKAVVTLNDCIRIYALRWYSEKTAQRISSPAVTSAAAAACYGLTGIKLSTPRLGLNIIRTSDGRLQKMIWKE